MHAKHRKTFTFEGRRYSVSADTMEELYKKMAQKKLELENGTKKIEKTMTAEAWIKEWLEVYKRPSVSADHFRNIVSVLRNHVLPAVGRLRMKDVKKIHLQKILNSMADLSDSYIKKTHVLIVEIFAEAQLNGLVTENPAERLSRPSGRPQKDRRSITESERKALLEFCENHWSGVFFKLQLFCGLRPSEAAALRWGDVDLTADPPRLSVTRAVKKDGSIGEPKSRSGIRLVPVPEHFARELTPGNPFDYVCLNASGNRILPGNYKRIWNTARRQMNLILGCRIHRNRLVPPFPLAEDFTMYCLRHTYCTDLEQAGVPINVARRLMGHSSIELTAKIYTHSTEEVFVSAARRINLAAK